MLDNRRERRDTQGGITTEEKSQEHTTTALGGIENIQRLTDINNQQMETTMKNSPKWISALDVTSIRIGDQLISSSGIEMIITDIIVGDLHLHRQEILVSYEYNDDGHKGKETVSFDNFYNNLHE